MIDEANNVVEKIDRFAVGDEAEVLDKADEADMVGEAGAAEEIGVLASYR